ncbi:MAG: IS1182 family transposase [Bacillota bacterium]
MNKTFRSYSPNQVLLLPPALQDWLPKDHLIYTLSDIVDTLDLSSVLSHYEQELRGYPPYHPVMMTKVLIYAYSQGVYSSRKIEKRLHEDVAFRVLAAGNTPDFKAISEFRRRHLSAFKDLFVKVLQLCRQAGMVKLGHVAIDGTKIKANASKHKAMSYGRMQSEEARLKAEIEDLMHKAEKVDRREDEEYGADRRGDELPQELVFRETRLKKTQEAKAALEAEAKAKAQAALEPDPDDPPRGRGKKKRKGKAQEEPRERDQRNFTDPDSRIMRAGKTFVQGYNGQAVVDTKSQVIVAAEATNQGTDAPQLPGMVEQMLENTGATAKEASADAGYFSQANVDVLEQKGIEAFIPPDKLPRRRQREPAPKGRIPRRLSPADRMRRKLRTKRGAARYQLRQESVEPVFGQIKEARGFRRFSLRGLEKVRAEWQLICLTHNVLKLAAQWRGTALKKAS